MWEGWDYDSKPPSFLPIAFCHEAMKVTGEGDEKIATSKLMILTTKESL